MGKTFLRTCSMVLVLVMIFNMLPLTALAEDAAENQTSDTTATPETVSEEVYIIGEIVEGRSEFIKEFQLSNGLQMAAVYGSAVHYEENGQWLEIDNTLKLANTRSGNVYTNTAGSWQVSFPQSLTQNNGVTITKGDYSLNFRMSGELHRTNTGTEVMDIPDNAADMDLDIPEDSMTETAPVATEKVKDEPAVTTPPTEEATVSTEEATAPTEETTAPTEETTAPTEETAAPTEESIALAEEPTVATETPTLPTEETTVPTEVATSPTEETTILTEEPSTPAEEETTPTAETTAPAEETTAPTEATEKPSTLASDSNVSVEDGLDILGIISAEDALSLSQPAAESTAIVEPIDTTALIADVEHEETVADKIYSKLGYADVYSNTDVVYELKSNQVKESIIMNQYDASLYGYTYLLDIGNMIPVLTDSGEIHLYDVQGEELVMVMPAPYLLDDTGEYCDDVSVALDESNGAYVLSYHLPQEWLADEDRKWPVVLDPTISPTISVNNIQDQTIASIGGFDYTTNPLVCGYSPSVGAARAYVQYTDIPALTSADVVVDARIRLCVQARESSNPVVEVHKVTETWSSDKIEWKNRSNASDVIEDYATCEAYVIEEPAEGAGVYWQWDVTDIVRGWYEGENTGMMFRMSDAVEAAKTENYMQFFSSDFSQYQITQKPTLTITFRNNNGLESYWDYTASSAGRAGTGYVNQYSGNLVWTREDIGFGGNRMPVTINHVYNANDSTKNLFGVGNGWRTNFNQRVYQWPVDPNYYVWEDADGTAHYFKHSSAGIYKDEDGLELTLTTTGSGTEKYCIKDKYGNCSYFDTYGRLTKQTNNQATKSNIAVTYTSTNGYPIASITDGAGRVYSFTYSGSLLSKITYQSGVSYVSFGYSGSNLTSITDKDGKSSTYTYTTNNLLSTAQDVDGYKLAYTYTSTTTGKPSRVKTISESYNGTAGGSLSIEYAHNQTKFTDHNTNVQIVQFNNWGNTVSIQDDLGRAQYAQYAFKDATSTSSAYTNPKGNQLRISSNLQNTVGNVLKDNSFENSTDWSSTSSYASCAIDSANAYIGSKSLKVTHTSNIVQAGAHSPSFTIGPGQTYTFSAYVKTGETAAYLAIGSPAVGYFSGEKIPANQNWTRAEFSYTNNSSANQTLYSFILSDGPGVTYLDCVQVEKAPTASRYNLIENGDFRYITSWSSTTGLTTLSAAAPELQGTVYKLNGNPTAANRISQTVKVSGSAGDTFVLAGWAKGDSVPLTGNRQFAMIATFKNGSTTVGSSKVIQFNPDADSTVAWQYAADALVAPGAYTSIVIELAYDYNANTAYFDGIQLYKEEFGSSYTYDANGNVTKVNDVQGGATTYTYNTTNDVTKVTLPDGSVTTYTYDSYHNVKTAKTNAGVTYSLDYDTYGNNTKVSITSGSTVMSSSAAYTASGNLLDYTIDAAGNKTDYTYKSTDTGEIASVTYPNGAVSNYTYDTMYRLATSTMSTGSQTLTATYGYTNDLLTSLKTGSTTYTFSYGAFSQLSSIKIGSRTLASYTYTSKNNYLDTLAYGNGDSVKYTYDTKGRVTKQAYEDGDTVTYKYDNNGALASVTDSATGITTTYYYDFADRMAKYAEKGTGYSHSVGYTYDEVNNVTALVDTINGVALTTQYAYDADNRVKTITGRSISETNSYDSLGRLSSRITTNGNGTTVLTDTISYRAVSSGTTGQVSTLKSTAAVYNVTYTYGYDANGNITSVSDGTYTTTYTYDSANQLVRENNQAAGKTWVWTYDDAGNITSRKEYAYTTGTLGTATDTDSYTYDSSWGDLLTGYDGKTVTSDTIGNITSDGTWTYTWEHGRELMGMTGTDTDGTDNEVSVSYTYNADGLRTSKTVTAKTYHVHDYTSVVVEATCTEGGYTTHTCSCGDSYRDSETAATGHRYIYYIVEPNCTRVGYKVYVCDFCEDSYSEEIPANGHSYSDTVIAPTCTEAGYTSHYCSECGDRYTDNEVAALGHDYVDTVVDPTATSEGYTLHTCSVCGDWYKDNYTYHEHSYTSTVVAPTCAEDGYTLHSCTCGDSYKDCVIAALGHDYWEMTMKPTEHRDGSSTYTCRRCDHVYTVIIHRYRVSIVEEPTCTTDGFTLYVCPCGSFFRGDEIPALGHDFVGTECSRCGYPSGAGTGPIPVDPIYPTIPPEIMSEGEGDDVEDTRSSNEAAEAMPSSSTGDRVLESTVVTEYDYVYTGSQLVKLTVKTTVDSGTPTTETLYFSYDASGAPMSVMYNSTTYYYATNLQGDVIAILNSAGSPVVKYTYDAWGDLLTVTGSMAATLGEANPLRYRGYVYDEETGLYYVSSRYYDPAISRFINADVLVSTGQGLLGNNMFAYCRNNPVRRVDITGTADADCLDESNDVGTEIEEAGRPSGGDNPIANGNSSQVNSSGYGRAPKQGISGSTYTQYSSDGKNNVVSQTTYNEYGVRGKRIDYQGRDHGVGLPHVHVYSWDMRNGGLCPTGEQISLYRM